MIKIAQGHEYLMYILTKIRGMKYIHYDQQSAAFYISPNVY